MKGKLFVLLLIAMSASACTTTGSIPRAYTLAAVDSAGHLLIVTEQRWAGADANFAVVTIWRSDGGASSQLWQLRLDDWCGSPIDWKLAKDGIVVPPVPATARRDPEQPDKCQAQLERSYVLRGDKIIEISGISPNQ